MIETYVNYGLCEPCYFIPPANIEDAVKICDGAGGGVDVEMHYYFEIDISQNPWKNKIESTKTSLAGS